MRRIQINTNEKRINNYGKGGKAIKLTKKENNRHDKKLRPKKYYKISLNSKFFTENIN